MINGIEDRESKVMDFINGKNKELEYKKAEDKFNDSPQMKMKKLNDECSKGVSVCIDDILGKIYKNALPFDDPKKNCSDDEARCVMKDLISQRTGGQSSEYYVREAIRKNNSPVLKTILTESKNITNKFYLEKMKDLGKVSLADLNFNINNNAEDINKITKKLELDEVSDIIRDNVQKVIEDESNKAKNEDEYNKLIEDELTDDPNVTDDETMESAIEKLKMFHPQPKVYQPSLFEAIMIRNADVMTESTGQDIFVEAVHEFTKLNVIKALKLESFSLNDVKKLANSYIG